MENITNTVFFSQTPYGEIDFQEYKISPLVPEKQGFRLYLDGGLQWDSRDEYRYHQALFLAPFFFLRNKKNYNVLILGGGDGLGVKQLLRFPQIKSIELVDISQDMINFAKDFWIMQEINENALNDNRVNVYVEDGLEFVKKAIKENKKWDMVILDYPDFKPDKNDPVNQLFSKEHYQDIKKLLKENGIMTLQATSVLLMPNTFRKLQLIVEDVFESILPYRINVPSFGDIGIIMARIQDKDWRINKEIPEFVFFTKETFANMVLLFQDEKPIFTDEVLQELELWELIDYDLRREKYF